MRGKYKKGPFSDDEVALIKRLFPKTETLEIADRLNRCYWSVKLKLRDLGLSRTIKPKWSKKQIEQLKRLYPTTAIARIANKLGFTPSQVRRKVRELDLQRKWLL